MCIASVRLVYQAPSGAACGGASARGPRMPLLAELEHRFRPRGYKHAAPQQPAKGAQLVGESPTRRIRRFTTEQPGACPAARLEGIEQSWQRTDGPK